MKESPIADKLTQRGVFGTTSIIESWELEEWTVCLVMNFSSNFRWFLFCGLLLMGTSTSHLHSTPFWFGHMDVSFCRGTPKNGAFSLKKTQQEGSSPKKHRVSFCRGFPETGGFCFWLHLKTTKTGEYPLTHRPAYPHR